MSQIGVAVPLGSPWQGEDVVWVEVGSYDSVYLQKTLRMLGRLEALHAALALPCRLM